MDYDIVTTSMKIAVVGSLAVVSRVLMSDKTASISMLFCILTLLLFTVSMSVFSFSETVYLYCHNLTCTVVT